MTIIKNVKVVAEINVEEYVVGPLIFAIMNSDSSKINPIATAEDIIVIFGCSFPNKIPN